MQTNSPGDRHVRDVVGDRIRMERANIGAARTHDSVVHDFSRLTIEASIRNDGRGKWTNRERNLIEFPHVNGEITIYLSTCSISQAVHKCITIWKQSALTDTDQPR